MGSINHNRFPPKLQFALSPENILSNIVSWVKESHYYGGVEKTSSVRCGESNLKDPSSCGDSSFTLPGRLSNTLPLST